MIDKHPARPKFISIFLGFLFAYSLVILGLSLQGDSKFEHLHLVIDTIVFSLSILLAIFLLAEQYSIDSRERQYLVIGFGFAAFTELLHALVGIEWVGSMAWIQSYSSILRPATWPPSTYVLPIAIAGFFLLKQRKNPLSPYLFAAGMVAVTVSLIALGLFLPRYVDTGILGIQRPTQVPLLFLWAWVIVMCWRIRDKHPLYEGVAWMGVMLFLSDVCMLYSTSPHEKFTMMAHSGKLMSYLLLHVIQMRISAEDARLRNLAESELRIAATVFQSHEGMMVTDANGSIIRVNHAFTRITGYEAEEAMGRTPKILKSGLHDADFYLKMWKRIDATGQWEGEIWNRRKDGTVYPGWLTITAVKDQQGNALQYVSTLSDISVEKKMQAELIEHQQHLEAMVAERTAEAVKAKTEAEQSSQAKSLFLANISHELRTPMHSILSFADLGLSRSLDESDQNMKKLHQFFGRISESANRLMRLLSDLLDLSKLEAGKMQLDIRPCGLRELVKGICEEMAAVAENKAIVLEYEAVPADIKVMCDRNRIGQVLVNLLSNAIKFSPAMGNVSVMAELTEIPGRRAGDDVMPGVTVRVVDEGVGVPAGELNAIFEKFVQSSKTATGAGGTGLGLSICQEIIQMHGGSIRAENNPERGASMIFTLPLVRFVTNLNSIGAGI